MKLESVYEIIKSSEIEDFYTPDREDSPFIYKDDVNLIISRNREKDDKDVFGYDYFYNSSKELKEDLPEEDKLVLDICKIKDFPETYNRIRICTWEVKYSGEIIYELNYILISNLSSLHMMIPLRLKASDFEYNFCQLWNSKNSPNQHFPLENRLEIKDTSFEDFLLG